MKTIETKFAKNGSLICKINGKRAKRETVEEAIRHANIYGDNVEIKNEFGSVYTSKFNGDIYRFADQYGNKETFVYADDVVYKLARVHFDAPATAPVEVKAEAAPATAETANVEETAEAKAVEETATVEDELPNGDITVNSGAAAWELVGKHFPNGVNFNRAGKGFNHEDIFNYTNDKVIFVEVSCTPDNSRVEYIEIINTNESDSARYVLSICIAEPAPVEETAPVIAPVKVLALPAPAEKKTGAVKTVALPSVIYLPAPAEPKAGAELKADAAAIDAEPETIDAAAPVKYVATQITFPTGREGELTREISKTFDTIDDAARFLADDNPLIETEPGKFAKAYNGGCYFGGAFFAGERIVTTAGDVIYAADSYETKGDEDIATLVFAYSQGYFDEPDTEPPVDDDQDNWVDIVEEPYKFTVQDCRSLERSIGIICQDRIDAINAKAPADWAVNFEVNVTLNDDATDYTIEQRHWVTYNGKFVEEILPVTCDDVKHADKFFDRFRNSPCALAAGLNRVFQSVVRGIGYMDVTTQDGAKIATTFGAAYVEPDWRAADGYVFGNHCDDVLARYETVEQVIDVMTALRDAIRAGKTEFTFPPVDDSPAAPVDDSPAAPVDDSPAAPEPDTVVAVSKICETVNAVAPAGWEVFFDSETKSFPVTFNGSPVTNLDSLSLAKALPPEKFFTQFRPLVDHAYTVRQQFLDDRYRELRELQAIREGLGGDSDRAKILDGLINRLKRDILDAELEDDKPPAPPLATEYDEPGAAVLWV